MTLKQFFQLAGGVVISLIIYATPLPAFIKWPLVLLFALIGVGLAFLPIEERPLSVWFLAFIKAVYSPTEYVYAQNGAEEIFAINKISLPDSPNTPVPSNSQSGIVDSFEQVEQGFLEKVATLFQTIHPSTSSGQVPSASLPSDRLGASGTSPSASPASAPTPNQIFIRAEETDIPRQQTVKIELNPVSVPTTIPAKQTPAPVTQVFNSTHAQPGQQIQQATFTPSAAPPTPAEQPNTIVGQVITQDGHIVDAAILEIKNSAGIPVRALRSNRVGHFITVTPLADGGYEIITEKEGLEFETVKFVAEGKLIPPIEIRAKG